ncbi:MAG: polysaccharide biosynthesis protein [Clostridia bacterium]|nr:polysaccharide biosynthesis protein [Clostridia bacterium]
MNRARKIAVLVSCYDVFVSNLAYGLALWIRFDFSIDDIPKEYLDGWLLFIPFFTVFALAVNYFCGLHGSIWRYVSYDEVYRVAAAVMILAVFDTVATVLFGTTMPRSYYLIGPVLQFLFIIGARVSYRMLRRIIRERELSKQKDRQRTLVVGAGQAGVMLIRDINAQENRTTDIIGIVDDNTEKLGRRIEGLPILGTTEDIPDIVEREDIKYIIIAIPSLCKERRRQIIDICKTTGCSIKMMPNVSKLVMGEVKMSDVREVTVEDLLARDQIVINSPELKNEFEGRRILVTGGGGSIGSELVRQLASYRPAQLIVFDIYENNAYEIQQELKRKYSDLNLTVLIGSVRDEKRIRQIMEEYRPELICHAAAHKHVPLMEDSPCEAIKNNVIGTYNVAKLSAEYGAEAFCLISTDKAVNPTNIMGASKRMCEMVVQGMRQKYPDTQFSIVRFGNVLGSNGSVVPLFKKQIAEGGPVTVTDPRITRYFMTIPEAVALVLQTKLITTGQGEIFVLDMGNPVKIDDLARNMIYFSGKIPDVDIKIEYTGLRPGEKLYEELLMNEEGLQKTANNLIYIGSPIDMPENFWEKFEQLRMICEGNSASVMQTVAGIVKTYRISA